jgi:hypothetical protein
LKAVHLQQNGLNTAEGWKAFATVSPVYLLIVLRLMLCQATPQLRMLSGELPQERILTAPDMTIMVRCWSRLVELDICGSRRAIDNVFLEAIANSCPNLRALMLTRCSGLTKEVAFSASVLFLSSLFLSLSC